MSVAWTPSPRIRARAANAAVLRVNEGMVKRIWMPWEVLRMVGVRLGGEAGIPSRERQVREVRWSSYMLHHDTGAVHNA